jgi:hypothetical protein
MKFSHIAKDLEKLNIPCFLNLIGYENRAKGIINNNKKGKSNSFNKPKKTTPITVNTTTTTDSRLHRQTVSDLATPTQNPNRLSVAQHAAYHQSTSTHHVIHLCDQA